MTRRYAVPVEQLEASARVAVEEQVESQTPTVPVAPPPVGVHPYGDGMADVDGDGD